MEVSDGRPDSLKLIFNSFYWGGRNPGSCVTPVASSSTGAANDEQYTILDKTAVVNAGPEFWC